MSNETKPSVELKSSFAIPASAQECGMEEAAQLGMLATPCPPASEYSKKPVPGAGTGYGE